MDTDALREKLKEIRLDYHTLHHRKKSFERKFVETQQMFSELRSKSHEAAISQDCMTAKIAIETKMTPSKLSLENEHKFEYSERKLSVQHHCKELETYVRRKCVEVKTQNDRLFSLEKQVKEATQQLASYPNRYQESTFENQKKLLLIMAERSDLDSILCKMEAKDDTLVNQLRNQLSDLYREISDAGDEFRETKRNVELLSQRINRQKVLIEVLLFNFT